MIERVRFITHAVGTWLGLRTLPIGILYLYLSIQTLGLRGFPQQGDCTLSGPLFLLMMLALVGIELYYSRAIGRVKLISRQLPLLITGVVVVMGMAGWVIDTSYILPVSLFALFMAVCYISYGWMEKRPFQLSIGILLIVAGTFPILLNISQRNPIFGTTGFVILFLIFLLFTVGGILDHLTIMRAINSALPKTDVQGGEDVRAG